MPNDLDLWILSFKLLNISIFSLIVAVLLYYIYKLYNKVQYRNTLYIHFEVIESLYFHSIETAYKNVYRTDILPYFASGYTLDDSTFSDICKKFIKLVFLYMGDNVLKDLELIHGSKESIITYLTNELRNKVQDDAVVAKNVNQTLKENQPI